MRTRVFLFAAVGFAGGVFGASGVALGEGPGWKNLQVLPKDIPKDKLKAIMKANSKSLGVECDFCHEMPNPEKETKKKIVAREMMKMTAEINAKYLKGQELHVTCATCHRGKEKPEVAEKK